MDKFDWQEMLNMNSDIAAEAHGIYCVFTCDGPLFGRKNPKTGASSFTVPQRAQSNRAANKVKNDTETLIGSAEQVDQLFTLISQLTAIKVSAIQIRIESMNKKTGQMDAVGIGWRGDVFAYQDLPQFKRKDYEVDKLGEADYNKTNEKELKVNIPTIYFKKNAKAINTGGSVEAFSKVLLAEIPRQNGYNGTFLILDGNEGLDQISLALRFCQRGTRAMCCFQQVPSCLQWMFCCCDSKTPKVAQTELIGFEMSFHQFQVNLTDDWLPLFEGSGLFKLMSALGNTGFELDDRYTLEYILYTAFFTTVRSNTIVARDHFPGVWKGKRNGVTMNYWLGGPGDSWIHVLTPSGVPGQTQSVGAFCYNAPNNKPLLPGLVIDMSYREDIHEFPDPACAHLDPVNPERPAHVYEYQRKKELKNKSSKSMLGV